MEMLNRTNKHIGDTIEELLQTTSLKSKFIVFGGNVEAPDEDDKSPLQRIVEGIKEDVAKILENVKSD